MMIGEWGQIGRLVVDSGLLVLIWIVQLIIYPGFRFVESESFVAWHKTYTARIGYIVAPLMLFQLGLVFWGLIESANLNSLVQFAMCLSIWFSTFFYSVPCHSRLLAGGKDTETIDRLVRTNWFRTVVWSAIWLLQVVVSNLWYFG